MYETASCGVLLLMMTSGHLLTRVSMRVGSPVASGAANAPRSHSRTIRIGCSERWTPAAAQHLLVSS